MLLKIGEILVKSTNPDKKKLTRCILYTHHIPSYSHRRYPHACWLNLDPTRSYFGLYPHFMMHNSLYLPPLNHNNLHQIEPLGFEIDYPKITSRIHWLIINYPNLKCSLGDIPWYTPFSATSKYHNNLIISDNYISH